MTNRARTRPAAKARGAQHRPGPGPGGLRDPGVRGHGRAAGRQCGPPCILRPVARGCQDQATTRVGKPRPQRPPKVAADLRAAFFGMVGAAYAAVPLYKLFCQATGFDGTVRKAEPSRPRSWTARSRFDSTPMSAPCPGTSQAMQTSQDMRIGDTGLAFFKVTNTGDKPMTGRALYNVVPEQAGPYFQKLECFCFSSQTISPARRSSSRSSTSSIPQFVDDVETKGKSRSRFPTPSSRPSRTRRGVKNRRRRRRASFNPLAASREGAIAFNMQRFGGGTRPVTLRGIKGLARTWPTAPSNTTITFCPPARGRSSARISATVMAIGLIGWIKGGVFGIEKGQWWLFATGFAGVLYTMFGWWRDVVKEANAGDHTPVVSIGLRYGMVLFIASEVMFFVAWFWIFFEMALFHHHRTLSGDRGSPHRLGHLAAGRRRGRLALAPAAGQHPDPAAVGHDHHLVAPRPAARRPQGRQVGPDPDHPAGRAVHDDPDLRVQPHQPRAPVLLGSGRQFGPLRFDLLPGHRLPRLPRVRRHPVPDRLPDPADERRLHAQAALRLRSRRLVLALRGRGLAVPVRLRLRDLRRLRRTRSSASEGARNARAACSGPFSFQDRGPDPPEVATASEASCKDSRRRCKASSEPLPRRRDRSLPALRRGDAVRRVPEGRPRPARPAASIWAPTRPATGPRPS
jgi:cytochrome c oxidase assembly protein Cox11